MQSRDDEHLASTRQLAIPQAVMVIFPEHLYLYICPVFLARGRSSGDKG